MLALSRYAGENVVITLPDETRCIVSVASILQDKQTGGWKVRLGFNFPKDITIHREEVQNQIDGIDPQARPSVAAIRNHRRD